MFAYSHLYAETVEYLEVTVDTTYFLPLKLGTRISL